MKRRTQRFVRARVASHYGLALLALLWAFVATGGEIKVSDRAEGGDYMSGLPATLPAAVLSKNRFDEGAHPIRNRNHTVRAASFDAFGALSLAESAKPVPFPAYLKGNPYVSFLQDVRHYTNYACTVSVDVAVTFYLLVDNRVNDFREISSLDDPSFGPPDTEWVLSDGWERVNTGLSPKAGNASRPDYLLIDEGGVNEYGVQAIHQFYAIYSRTFPKGGSVTLQTQYQGNMYCLVVATNGVATASGKAAQAKSSERGDGG
jgi:hypothetical protein